MSRWTDKSLARRIACGNQKACVKLVTTHHASIYRLLTRLCHDGHLAEDLTQETFTAAWSKIGGYEGASSLSTWLHAIAYRKFLDWRRRCETGLPVEPDWDVGELRSASCDPLDAVTADEESRRLHEALARLPGVDRDVLVLHYMQGLSYREMAHVLGEPDGTVKWRTSRALENLKHLLDGECDEDSRTSGRAVSKRSLARKSIAAIASPTGA